LLEEETERRRTTDGHDISMKVAQPQSVTGCVVKFFPSYILLLLTDGFVGGGGAVEGVVGRSAGGGVGEEEGKCLAAE